DCGVPGLATQALVSPAATVITSNSGACVLGCSVTNAANVIDSNSGNFATMSIPLGLVGSTSLTVMDSSTFPAGREVGFIMANGQSVLDLALLNGASVETLLNGTVQEIATAGSLLTLNAAGLISIDPDAGFVNFRTSKPFNQVQLVVGSVAALNSNVR